MSKVTPPSVKRTPKTDVRLPDDQVTVKTSTCSKCDGLVTASVEHMMNSKMKKDFFREAERYNLNISSQPLLEFRAENKKWCECK